MDYYTITAEDIEKYRVRIDVTVDWVASRDPEFPVNSASLNDNRFNSAGETAYYLASGYDTMMAEVTGWQTRQTYKVAAACVDAFNLALWSEHKGCHAEFLSSKQDGGYGICQAIAKQLTEVHGVSGILYNSVPVHSSGGTGYCLVILPLSGGLLEDTFFINDLRQDHR